MRKRNSVGVLVLALTTRLGCEEDVVDCSTLSMDDCAGHSDCQVIKAQQMDLERGCQQTPVPMVCLRVDLLCPAVVGILRGPDSKCWVFNMCGPERDTGWTDDCDVTGYPPSCATP